MKDTGLSGDQLLAMYGRVAGAEDAIPRLRRFVLDLAVRGKLVAQDAADEPASELLKRIEAEKARLEKAGEIKKIAVEPFEQDEIPHPLPQNWAWTRLGAIGDWGAGSTPSRGNPDLYGGPITWLKSGELNDNKALRGSEETVTEKAVAKGSFRLNKPGDVLIAMYGATIGKLAILAEHAVTNQAVCGCTPLDGITNHFLFLFLLSYREQFHSASEGGAQPNISKVKIVRTFFPLPPLAEQHRIVAKVAELMGLLDQLEQTRARAEGVRARLTTATWARLTSDAADAPQNARHADFALKSLPALTTTPAQIKALRQTILNLAVRGKLVAQDPNDEPASALLERIAEQRSAERRRTNSFAPIDEHHYPFTLPPSWEWTRFGQVFSIRTGFAFKSSTYSEKGLLVFRVVNFNRDGSFDLSDAKFFPEALLDEKIKGFLLEAGETLMVMVGGTIGKTTQVTHEILPALLNQNMWRIRSYGKTLARDYEYLLIKTINQQVENLTTSTHGHFAMSDYEQKLIPLPPLAEQHRIVAKVDALMALCDRLETALTTTATTKQRLLETLIRSTLTPDIELPLDAE